MKLKFLKLVLLVLISLVATEAKCEIWKATEQWDMAWEEEYARWISSARVNTGLFMDRRSKYYGIKADCADAAYAMRAIFAFENSLPFKISAPSGSRGAFPHISNDTNSFSSHGSPVKQLVAMINYLGLQVGTEHLSYKDSLPVSIEGIIPGTFNMYKIKQSGNYIRHTYIIKDVQKSGDFELIWSTQAIARERALMQQRVKSLSKPPTQGWGFRRFKWPQYLDESASIYPHDFNYSNEQYQLVSQLGTRGFFRHVKNSLATEKETYQQLLVKKFNSLCLEARDRVNNVNGALVFRQSINGRCMDYSEYDAYSTPSRDKSLQDTFIDLDFLVKEIVQVGAVSSVDHDSFEIVKSIFNFSNANSYYQDQLARACSISISQSKSINLGELYFRFQNGSVSSHPNDGLEQRWGETTQGRTNCKKWY